MSFMKPRRDWNAKLVPTQQLMNLVLTGMHSTDPRVRDAAESVFSLMLTQVKKKHIGVPAEAQRFVDLLRGEQS